MTDTLLGSKIGHFRIVEKIAAGGMGEVYAGFDETLQRKVALKRIRPEYHLDGEARGRFLREARVLSQLGHPNICQIYDYLEGDRSDFIVMELVEGRSLGRAIKKGLDPRVKIRVAEQVAGVLVAAHGKGVVHRDLKPDNVMLGEGDTVKVLDFGLSRRLGDEVALELLQGPIPGTGISGDVASAEDETRGLAEGSAGGSAPSLTTAGTIMGTIGYMSPEQARGEVATAASDIYSFGLLLQELFTGSPPYQFGLDAACRLERARRGETLPVTGVEPDLAALIGRLKSPEPAARPSAVDVADKLAWIRLRPQRRRKRFLLGAAMTVLAAFGAAMTVQSISATRAERRALREAETARKVSDFLVKLFEVSDPSEARGKTITAREILDEGAKRIPAELKDQPVVQARLLLAMGAVYVNLGLYQEAEPLLTSGVAQCEKHLAPSDPDLASALNSLAVLRWRQAKYGEAESLYKRALAIREKALGPAHPDVSESLNNLANLYEDQGKYSEAEPLFQRSIQIAEKADGPDQPSVAKGLCNLGALYTCQGRYAEAEPIFRRAVAIQEKTLGADHPDVALSLNNLAAVYWNEGKMAEAEPLFKRSLAIWEKVLGPEHPDVGTNVGNLANVYFSQGKYDEAEPLMKRALAIQEKAQGPEHPELAGTLCNLANLYNNEGRYTEAEPLYLRALAISEKGLGPDHPDVAQILQGLGNFYGNQGRHAQAEPMLQRALAIFEKSLGSDHQEVAYSMKCLGVSYRYQGKCDEAEPLLEKALAIQEKAGVLGELALCELKAGKLEEASAHSLRCLQIAREKAAKAPEDRDLKALLASACLLRGQVESAEGKGEQAQPLWQEALDLVAPIARGSRDVGIRAVHAQILLCLGRTEEARPIVTKLLDTGYRTPDLLDICREKGLAPPEAKARSKP